jgi:hypothetical protein
MVGEDPQRMLSQLARLGARLIIQRAVEDEFDAWLGRSRYERRPDAPPGKRNGFRPRHVQSGEGELRVEIPQVREAAEPFVSRLFPHGYKKRLLRTEPLKAMVIGAFVRGLSMRDVESLCVQAGLGRPRSRPRLESALSCTSGSSPSNGGLCMRSSWSRCSSTRSTCRSVPTDPRRGAVRLGVH